jgi:hypothetical protein
MEGGKQTASFPSLDEIRDKARQNLDALPAKFKKITSPPRYKVAVSRSINETVNSINNRMRANKSKQENKRSENI